MFDIWAPTDQRTKSVEPSLSKNTTTRIVAMLSRRNVFPAALAALLGVAAPALAATKTSRATPFDTDNDGTVDIDEARKAAGELFD
jgi:hypothetical protein